MAGTGYKCMKCGKIFRKILGTPQHLLDKVLTTEEKEKFKGEDFICCGEEYLKSLTELGMVNERMRLQIEWVSVMKRLGNNIGIG